MNQAASRRSIVRLAIVGVVLGACGGGSKSPPPTPAQYKIAGTVSGLVGSGLVLRNGGVDLPIAADGAFEFAATAANGTEYAISVAQQPTTPWQTCSVDRGAGTVADADVAAVVTCATNTYAIGGTAPAGLTAVTLTVAGNAPQTISSPPAGAFAFPGIPSGAQYTVAATAPNQTCTASNGTGTLAGEDVTNIAFTCSSTAFVIRGTIAGVPAAGLTLGNGATTVPVAAGATAFEFPVIATGAAYTVAVQNPPAGLTCNVSNGTGTMGTSAVTNVAVSCSSGVAAWGASTTWGGVWREETDGIMLQHAHFDADGIVVDKGPSLQMAGGAPQPPRFALTGFPAPVGTRYGAGPFLQEAVNYQAQDAQALNGLPRDFLVCAVVKPARNRPFNSFEAPIIAKGVGDGEYPVFGGGWVLMQMHESWCFHYEYKDAANQSHFFMTNIPNYFAGQDFHGVLSPASPWPPELGSPDPALVVVCGGRDGNNIVVAANSAERSALELFDLGKTPLQTGPNPFAGPYTLDEATAVPLTIGGYHRTSPALRVDHPETLTLPDGSPDAFQQHTFDGLVYETAIWPEAATAANIRAKMQSMVGLVSGTSYVRNREATHVVDGKVRTVGRHAPRLDAAKGQLFGLQSWNRVSYWVGGNDEYPYPLVFPAGENLSLWNRTTGVTVISSPGTPPAVTTPLDASPNAAQLVTLPAGGSLSIELDQAPPNAPVVTPAPAQPYVPPPRRPTWDASGPIHGQVWLRPTTPGTLRIQKTAPQPGQGQSCTVLGAATTCESKDVAFNTLTANQWNRVSLNGSFTADATAVAGQTVNKGRLVLTNPGTGSISFYAWGVQLTQLGGGGNFGAFDPGPVMYDWNASRAHDGTELDDPIVTIDVLKVPATTTTPPGGFCLAAEATMPAGLPWAAPFRNARTVAAWVDDVQAPTRKVRLYVAGQDGTANAGKLCAEVTGASTHCAALPGGLDDGNKHVVRACLGGGQVRLAADQVALGSGPAAITLPNLTGGTFLVGNGTAVTSEPQTPWHGYVSRVFVCPDNGGAAADCR
jgi:hypothetical protein